MEKKFARLLNFLCSSVPPPPDGQPNRGVGLRPDGPGAAGGAHLHSEFGETDQESRLQRAAHPEVHPEVEPNASLGFHGTVATCH